MINNTQDMSSWHVKKIESRNAKMALSSNYSIPGRACESRMLGVACSLGSSLPVWLAAVLQRSRSEEVHCLGVCALSCFYYPADFPWPYRISSVLVMHFTLMSCSLYSSDFMSVHHHPSFLLGFQTVCSLFPHDFYFLNRNRELSRSIWRSINQTKDTYLLEIPI